MRARRVKVVFCWCVHSLFPPLGGRPHRVVATIGFPARSRYFWTLRSFAQRVGVQRAERARPRTEDARTSAETNHRSVCVDTGAAPTYVSAPSRNGLGLESLVKPSPYLPTGPRS